MIQIKNEQMFPLILNGWMVMNGWFAMSAYCSETNETFADALSKNVSL